MVVGGNLTTGLEIGALLGALNKRHLASYVVFYELSKY